MSEITLTLALVIAMVVLVTVFALTALASIRSREKYIAALKRHEQKIQAHHEFLLAFQSKGAQSNAELQALLERRGRLVGEQLAEALRKGNHA